jgi:tetratricopeptide (TPR) repeat protein
MRANKNRVMTAGAVIIVILVALWFAAPQRLHNMMRLKQVTRADTLMLRMNKYYQASWWLFKQSPLFGTGLWSYRNMVYKAQAEINEKNPGFFRDYPEPKPRRVHTDYLETLNDGGLVAAASLVLFLLVVMRHGWAVIRNETLDPRDRIIAAMAFSSLIAVMLANIFFFPFRINSTMFMTVLMMGILEGLYLRNYGLLSMHTGKRSGALFTLTPCVLLVLIGVVWYTGIKPLKGEMEHFKYKRALSQKNPKQAETHILKAIEYDPHNSAYCLYACQLYMNVLRDFGKANDFIERAILDYNGDLTYWSLYYIKGLLKFQMGSLFEARSAFQKALYYNPEFPPASKKLKEVNAVIKKHDKVLIKYR